MTQVTKVTHEMGCAKHSSLAFLATLSARCRRCVRPLRSRQGVDTTPEEKPTRAACGRRFQTQAKGSVFSVFSVLGFQGIFAQSTRVERQAGERVGAVNGTRPDAQRPEMPTARAFFGFGNGIHHGGVLRPMVPDYGAKTPVLLRKTRCYRWRIAIKMRKERNIMKNCRNVRISPLIEAADLYDPGGGMGFRLNA